MKQPIGALLLLLALVCSAAGIGCSKEEKPPPEIAKDVLKDAKPKAGVSPKPLPPPP